MKFAALATLAALAVPVGAQTIDKIKSSQTVTIAYRADALPFSFVENGEKAGYTVDVCKRVIASLEQQLNLTGLKINWIEATAQNRMDLVATGKADMECGATTVTLGRQEKVDFSNLVFVDGGALLAHVDAKIKTLGDLAAKKVAAIAGTTTETALNTALKQRLINATVVPVKSREEGLELVEGGTVDAFASDAVLLAGLGKLAKDPSKLELTGGEPFSMEPYAIVLPRGDWQFRLAVNRGLSQLYRSGEVQQVFNKYFGQTSGPTPLLIAMYVLNSFSE